MAKKRILVTDDDRMLQALLSHKLSRLQYDVIEAGNGREALDILGGETVDLVILDGMMPAMDGTETLCRLRSEARTADIPVIMLTARRSEGDVVAALEAERQTTCPNRLSRMSW